MDLLLQRDHSQSDISLLPSALISRNRRQTSSSGNVVAFLAATGQMKLFETGRLRRPEILSSGTTFRVETCKDEKTGAIVAVKRLQEANGTTNGSKTIDDSVLQEMLVSVYPPIRKHRNITQTIGYEILHGDGGTCIVSLVTEFSEVGSLAQYLARVNSEGQFISWEQKRAFAVDISSGLEALHRCWIAHGDVKPENILLFRERSTTSTSLLVAKLNDFGSSIVEDTFNVQNTPRDRKLYVGTPVYVPPIVRESSGRVPFHAMPYCDAFSFGLLLWTIYKGRMYYETTWKDARKTDQEYLNDIGIPGLKSHFEKFLADSKSVMPLQECKVLEDAFMACIKVNLAQHDLTIPLISKESILKAAFGHMSVVKRMLLRQEMDEDRYCRIGNSTY
jgi:serine/threonine protein kinase